MHKRTLEQKESYPNKTNNNKLDSRLMKNLGYLFSIGGLIALIITGINYLNDSESFSVLGLDVAVSKGNPTPVIISAIALIAGLLIIRASKK